LILSCLVKKNVLKLNQRWINLTKFSNTLKLSIVAASAVTVITSSPLEPSSLAVSALTQEFEEKYPKGMSVTDFATALGISDPHLAAMMFHAIDSDHNGIISAQEWLVYSSIISSGTPQEKLHFQFQIFDSDGDGRISVEELTELLRLHIRAGSIPIDVLINHKHFWEHGKRTPRDLAEQIMRVCDTDHDQYIDEAEFSKVCVIISHLIRWKEEHTPDKLPEIHFHTRHKHRPTSRTSTKN